MTKPSKDSPVILSMTSLQGVDNAGFDDSTWSPAEISQATSHKPNIAVISNGLNGDLNAPAKTTSDVLPNGSSHPNGDTNRQTDTPVIETAGKDTVQMKRSINLLNCAAIMVAVTGHVSIFTAPTTILVQVGSVGASLLVWLVGGLINLGLALCFAELGTMFPKAGGPYAYTMKSFGPLVGFLIMWGYTVLVAGPFWAYLARTAALYILKPAFLKCSPPQFDTAVSVLAGWIMITMVVINCVYMKYVTKVQTFLSGSKVILLAIIIGGGIYSLSTGNTEHFDAPFEDTTSKPGSIALALFYSVFSYGGWQVMTTMMEEIKDPARDPPRSVYISFAIVISKYLLTNVAYLTLLTPGEIKNAKGDSEAIALMYILRLFEPLTPMVSVFVALASIGALNASIMGHSRLLYAGARNGHMPQILGMIQTKYLTPWPSIFVYLFWGLAMLYSGDVKIMMEFISLFTTIMGLVVIFSLFYFRWTQPKANRPYKTLTIIPVLEVVVNFAVLFLGIYEKPHRMGIGLLILFAGAPVYWFGVLWKNKPKEFVEIVDKLTVFTQRLFLLSKVKTS